jgi:hypothetical protein
VLPVRLLTQAATKTAQDAATKTAQDAATKTAQDAATKTAQDAVHDNNTRCSAELAQDATTTAPNATRQMKQQRY